MNIKQSKEDIKRTGAEDLGQFYFNTLYKEMEDLAVTNEEEIANNAVEDFRVELYPVGFTPYNDIWRYEPVDSKYFFTKMIKELPTPKQQEFLDVVCGKDPFEFTDLVYEEADLMWGKGSGKDATSAKAFVYQAYKLCCLTDPAGFLGLGKGSPIDLVNVAASGDQAKSVFFQYLKSFVKLCKDPNTGHNWFSTKNYWWDEGRRDFKYMDLREKDGHIKVKEIEFGRGIQCHSLTSDRFTAEGKTIVLAVMDEVGAMRPDNVFGTGGKAGDESKIIGQYKSLGTSVRRSSKLGKMVCISYKYGKNCPMSILVRKNKTDPKKFVKVYSVYEVRTDKPEQYWRDQFASDYRDDPEVAKMMYECKDPDIETDNFFSNKFVIKNSIDAQNKFSINPFKKKIITCDDLSGGVDELLEPWFMGNSDYYYAVHGDLAKGQTWKKGDAAALAMGHLEEMRVTYDKAWIEFYKKKYGVDLSQYVGELRIGVVIDLVLQITCTKEQKELRISLVRKFIEQLQERRKFGIIKATFDRWGSVETIQELDQVGIEAEILSMDKSYKPWHTMKDFMSQGIWKTYLNRIWVREMAELIDTGKKIDHPKLSIKRFDLEGIDVGSKDLADATAGVTHTLVTELYNNAEVFFG